MYIRPNDTTHTTSRSMRCNPLGKELNSTWERSKSVDEVSNPYMPNGDRILLDTERWTH